MMKKKPYRLDATTHQRSAVWCPLLRRTLQIEVCGKLQAKSERKCRRAESGYVCPNLYDASIVSAFKVYKERKPSHA